MYVAGLRWRCDTCNVISKVLILYTPYISRGFYFREFRESGAIREFNNTQKVYLPSRRMNATPGMWLVYALLD